MTCPGIVIRAVLKASEKSRPAGYADLLQRIAPVNRAAATGLGWLFAGIIFFLALTPGCKGRSAGLQVGEQPESFAPADPSGKRVRVPLDFSGSVVVLRFWTVSCPACAIEMPQLDVIYQRYREKGFAVVAINEGQTPAEVREFAELHKLSYPMLLDQYALIRKSYGVEVYPTTFILDRKGRVRQKIVGAAKMEVYVRAIQELL